MTVTDLRSRAPRGAATAQTRLFREQLSQMCAHYLACHNFGHPTEPVTINPDGQVFVIGLGCGRCGMEIDRFRDSYTGRVTSRYWHPGSCPRCAHEGPYYFKGTGRTDPERKLEIEEAWRAEVSLPAAGGGEGA
jgi:hypothetical protein